MSDIGQGESPLTTEPQHAEYVVDPEMLRRAAEACRNIQKQVTTGRFDWFDWVPQHLEWVADQIDGEADAST